MTIKEIIDFIKHTLTLFHRFIPDKVPTAEYLVRRLDQFSCRLTEKMTTYY